MLLHSHPGADTWQFMSGPDHDTESSYAYLVREITGHPLVGMTLAADKQYLVGPPLARWRGEPDRSTPLHQRPRDRRKTRCLLEPRIAASANVQRAADQVG